jgi:hypothetical protein
MNAYSLYPDGKVKAVGLAENDPELINPIQGTEPWLEPEQTPFDWQYVGGVWSKFTDVIEEGDPVFMSSQDISHKPNNPNIERKAFILESNQNWYMNQLDIVVGIRHIKDGVKFLDYDTKITLEATGIFYELFLTKQSVDGLNNVEALQFMVAEADNAGIIDKLITIY